MFEDKTLKCKECGAEFVFTAGEQEFYKEKGFLNEPNKCKPCRDAKKRRFDKTGFNGNTSNNTFNNDTEKAA